MPVLATVIIVSPLRITPAGSQSPPVSDFKISLKYFPGYLVMDKFRLFGTMPLTSWREARPSEYLCPGVFSCGFGIDMSLSSCGIGVKA